jgi:hypothetical protein
MGDDWLELDELAAERAEARACHLAKVWRFSSYSELVTPNMRMEWRNRAVAARLQAIYAKFQLSRKVGR